MATTVLRPNEIVAAGSWLSSGGGAAVHTNINEAVTQPADQSGDASNNQIQATGTMVVGFASMTANTVTSAVTAWAWCAVANDVINAPTLNLRLMNGAVQLGSTVNVPEAAAQAWYSIPASGLSLSNEDVSNLTMEFISGGTGVAFRYTRVAYLDVTYEFRRGMILTRAG